jgi:HEAT repeat protein
VPGLVPLLGSVNEELAGAAARALGTLAVPEAEAPLCELLRAGSSVPVLVEVARALGRAGTAPAVPALHAAAERLPDRELQRAARDAVAEIQSRLQGAEPGQLSLAGADAGQVSLSDEDHARGQVSLAEEGPSRPPRERR